MNEAGITISSPLSCGENHSMKFVFEGETFDFGFVGVLVRGSLDILFDAVHFFVSLVILVEETGEMVIVDLKLVDGFAVLGEFVEEVVFFDGHIS
jgi:hypothetical protein